MGTTANLKLRYPASGDTPDVVRDFLALAGDVDKNIAFTTPEAQGATGNGVADDTTYVQAALNTGLNVFLPGQYKITAKLTLATANQRVWGNGMTSRIIFDGNVVPVAMGMADTTQRQFIRLESFRITSSSAGKGLGIDASHFATCLFYRVNIDGVNQGIDFNSNDCFYNLYEGRIVCSGSSGFCVRIANGANENTLTRCRLLPDASSTGVIVDAHSCELIAIDVETAALIGIDVRSNGNACAIVGPYLEANATNLQVASGVQGCVVVGGTIESATTANLSVAGEVEFVNCRVQFASFNWSSKAKTYNLGSTSGDAVILDQSPPGGTSTLRDSHIILLRGAYSDSGGTNHTVDWRIVTNVTSATGGSKLRFMSRLDAASYVEKMSIDGSGVLVLGGRAQLGGPLQLPFAAKSADYPVSATTDGVLTMDATAAQRTFTLPTAVNIQGRSFTLKRINSSGSNVVVATTSSQTIDGATTKTLGAQWSFITVTSDGANWLITAQGGTVT